MTDIKINPSFGNKYQQIKLTTTRKTIDKKIVDSFQLSLCDEKGNYMNAISYQGPDFKKEFALAMDKLKKFIGFEK